MKKFELYAASALAVLGASPAFAQSTQPANPPQDATATTTEGTSADQTARVPARATQSSDSGSATPDIIVTAQRQSQRLQQVPIAVTAFTAQNLDRQQIQNPTSLQLTIPSVTYTKTNFTSSSFTIRGISDLCVGVTCDSATAIHFNDMPIQNSRLFEQEFFDLERIEVLRGPQGTLFGRNATSGVVNFITAKPDLSGIHASGEAEYGNYNSIRVKGMVNLPIGSTLGIRVAGLYLNRDGYTKNLYNNTRIDGRDLYSIRGTLTWEPSPDTRVDLIGSYFREKDDRSRVQKQLCHRDPTGILGCLPDRTGNDVVNANSQLTSIFSSQEALSLNIAKAFGTAAPLIQPLYAPLAGGSLYGTDAYAGATNPLDPRQVNTDFTPNYYAEEETYQAKIFHDFGGVSLNITGGYDRSEVVSQAPYNFAVAQFSPTAIATLNAYATPGVLSGISPAFASLQPVFAAYRNALVSNGKLCVSAPDPNNLGVFSGATQGCYSSSIAYDESSQTAEQYSVEGHIDSKWDGMFNFLLGGIYYDSKVHNNSYYVNAQSLDYTAALLGSLTNVGNALQCTVPGNPACVANLPPLIAGTPFYRNNTIRYNLKSYGIFGETYFTFSPKLKLTVGLRYNHDEKSVQARNTLFVDSNGKTVTVPVGATSFNQALGYPAAYDFDALTAGNQEYAVGNVKFSRLTGRAVIDYQITPRNLLYGSYSRGYKSGGINPPLSPGLVPATFAPESVDAFEIGSKNQFGALRLNLTGFYYKYKGLQLSRIVNRTAVNDNVDANIYGMEAEAIMAPVRNFVVNASFSWLQTKVANDKFLADTRDPSGGRSDAVIIKDVSTAANCAVGSNTGSAAAVNAFVGAVNGIVSSSTGNPALLRPPVPIPGTNTTGAFSVCSALAGAAQYGFAALGSTPAQQAQLAALEQANFGTTGALPFTYYGSGVPVNIRGNRLPGAPTYKASVGAQYTIEGRSFSVVPRVDLAYTGNSFASVFNTNQDRLQGFAVINAQLTINGPSNRWYVRGFVQNLTDNNAITGQYVGDQSSGLYQNIFTLEPRRYGIAAGFSF